MALDKVLDDLARYLEYEIEEGRGELHLHQEDGIQPDKVHLRK